MCDFILLQLPTITFSSTEIKRATFIKFLGVIIDKKFNMERSY